MTSLILVATLILALSVTAGFMVGYRLAECWLTKRDAERVP
jgi:hypothetical protein